MKQILLYLTEKLRLDKNTNIGKDLDPNDPSGWAVGDILAGTSGWSMTLPRFYKIIKRTAKSFVVQRMKGKIVSGHRNGQWEEVADETAPLTGQEISVRVRKYGGVSIDGCHVRLWDGKPLYGDDMD